MIMESTLIASHTKAFLACAGLFFVAVVDTIVSPLPWSTEDVAIKGGGAGLIVFLVRVILKSWDEHKATLEKTVAANTEALQKVHSALEDQTSFFNSIGRNAINRALNQSSETQLSAARKTNVNL